MKSASVIAFQAAVMFILIFVGYFLYKKKLMGEETTRQLSNITISIINPIVIFNSYQTEFDSNMLRGLLCAMALALAAQVILIAAAHIAVRKGRDNSPTERFALAYSNCAFMGIPLVEAVFGSDGVFFLTAYITMFNIFMWTHGVCVMSSEKGGIKRFARILVSPSVLAIVLGLAAFFTGLRLPRIIQLPMD
ncbi:MAG: AEC family transporter, partial [Oscillospiraceae bacterium]|nr:AEC family transporter [Oscillospiraceae bacterium]